MSKNRTEQVIDYIRKHPELSGNQIYIATKALGFGIQKQRFYQIYRQEKIQPSVPPPKKKKPKVIIKKIPKKTVQKKIIPVRATLTQKDKLFTEKVKDTIEYPEDPNVEYGLIEVYDKKRKESYWIKYQDKDHLDWQIDRLEASDKRKGFSPDYDFIFHKLKPYTPFVSPEFEKMLEENGLT